QVSGDLIAEHFAQAQPEKVGRIAAVGPSRYIASGACGTARTPVTKRTTVGKAGANGVVGIQIADAVAFVGALALSLRKLALEELASSPNRTKRIAVDDEY